MAVFLVLAGFVAFILYRQIWEAFMANPGLNALIIGVMLIGIVLAIRQVWRLFPGGPLGQHPAARPRKGSSPPNPPVLLAPHGGLHQQPAGPVGPVDRRDPLAARFDRRPPRREPRDRALSRRPAGLPRPARHLLGPDRHGRLGRAHHLVPAHRAGFGGPVRRAEELARRPAAGHGPVLLGLALRPRRLARPRLPRPPGRPGAEPLLHGARGLARHLHHGHAGAEPALRGPAPRTNWPSPSTG